MRALDKKLVRDIWALRGQVAAIAAVIICGVGTLIALASVYDAMRLTRQAYYDEYALADVFASLTRAPESVAEALRRIPGVSAVETRVVVPVTLDLPGRTDVVTGRIVSIPDTAPARLNQLFLRRGRTITAYAADEILASEAFADTNDLALGRRIGIVVNGRWQRPRIVGVAISPEYVYEVGPGELWPDSRHFGVLWMGRRALGAAFDMTGAFNDVALGLSPQAQVAEVLERVDRILAPYGGTGAYARHDQLSDFVTSAKIQQLRSLAVIIPSVFLGIATFLASLLLSRLVRTDRIVIGTLKAFGYSGARIARHYVTLALIVVLIGGAIGVAGGIWLGKLLALAYAPYFHFPLLRYQVSPALVATALLVTAGAGLGGAFGAARAAAGLPPAEAMEPEAPAFYRPALADRLGTGRRLPITLRMILRNLERRPLTALATILGIALATSLLVVGQGVIDGAKRMIETQFVAIQRDDLTLTFNHVRGSSTLLDVRRLPGVLRAEPFRSVAARLRAGQHSYRIGVTGARPGEDLRRILDDRGRPRDLPSRGMLLSATVAKILHVAPGDSVEVDALEGRERHFIVPVAALIDEPIGVTATMELEDLDRRLGEESTISGAHLAVDALAVARLDALFKRTPEIAGVVYRRSALENAQHTFNDSVDFFIAALLFLSTILTLGVVYNSARIALAERGRELATLRIVGFTKREIATVLLGEHALLTAIAIPLGLVLGYLLLLSLVRTALRTELYREPFVIAASTCALSVIAVAIAAALSGAVVGRRLEHLDLIAVLKGE
ncbi:MAG: ABC transporter permease [Vulcanimicrobiaceae bacterium]